MDTGNQGNTNTAQNAGNTATGAGSGNTTQEAAQKTFTQEELDAIVNNRLSRERKKYDGVDLDELMAKAKRLDELEEASKTELQKATEKADALKAELDALKKADKVRELREKVAKDTGVPAELLTMDTEEACKEQAEAIKKYANPGYPNVKDGGDAGSGQGASTREMFANWMQSQM